eukprot:366012-Chlamydomonas_euryale.AAC.21
MRSSCKTGWTGSERQGQAARRPPQPPPTPCTDTLSPCQPLAPRHLTCSQLLQHRPEPPAGPHVAQPAPPLVVA